MAKPFLLPLSLCLLLFTSACLGNRSDRFNECQLDSINALEPDYRIESEAGVTETWNSNHPELRCAGVTLVKRTIDPDGLHMPSYANYPQLIMILQGEGVLGISAPGCADTYEEPQPQSRQGHRKGSSHSQKQQQQDSHQKIRHFRQGDVIAIPPGIPYWTYNYGKEQLVAITLLDITNLLNQLDPNPRTFYLAGNPEEEHPETQKQQQQHQSAGGRKHGQPQQQEKDEGSSVLSGFATKFLVQALNVDEETARKLKSPDHNQIMKVKKGLSILSPEGQEEEEEEEEEEEQQQGPQRGRHGQREEEDKPQSQERRERQSKRHQQGRQGQGQEKEEEEGEEEQQQGREREHREWHKERRRRQGQGEEEEEEKEQETRTRESRQQGRGPGQQGEEEEEEEQQQPQQEGKQGRQQRGRGQQQQQEEQEQSPQERRRGGSQRGQGSGNGLEETICTARLLENIADPSRAEFYNPRAGRINTVNSFDLPILRLFQLSAEYVVLYQNGIYNLHWNNANGVIYVIRGRGWVQVVNCRGNSVFNGELQKGQLFVVPQNFVVAYQAGNEGFEYIAFKTNDRTTISPLKQVFRGIPAEVLANAFGLCQYQVSKLKYNGNQGPLVNPQSQSQSQDRSLVKVE